MNLRASLLVVGLLSTIGISAHASDDPSTVLVLVNDAYGPEAGTGGKGASVFVGEHYAERRGIPANQVLHLNIPFDVLYWGDHDSITYANYVTYIQTPVKNFLEQNGLKDKILYIVPTYGVPVIIGGGLPSDPSHFDRISLDSVLSAMYSGFNGSRLSNMYFTPGVGNWPLHFHDFVNPSGYKMYLVSRLDGPNAMISAALVDKAIEGEQVIQKTLGTAYFDFEHVGNNSNKFLDDQSMLLVYMRATQLGIPASLNDQSQSGGLMAPASTYHWTSQGEQVFTLGRNVLGANWTLPGATDAGTVRMALTVQQLTNDGTSGYGWAAMRLQADGANYWEFGYKFPTWGPKTATLQKIIDGEVVASCQVDEQATTGNYDIGFQFTSAEGHLLVNGQSACTATDAANHPLQVNGGVMAFWGVKGLLTGLDTQDAQGNILWHDDFSTDPAARYQWSTQPAQALNASWVWGWYGPIHDAYSAIPGGIAAQLTSYTANQLRSGGAPETDLNWCVYFLNKGFTATWGATGEPSGSYPMGSILFDHFWRGYTFGESAYLSITVNNWTSVFVGDPLYAPPAFAATPPVPLPPQSLFFGNPQTDSLILSWMPSTNATPAAYLLDVATDPAFLNYVPNKHDAVLSPSVNNTLISGLQPDMVYYVRMRASSASGTSAYSATASAKTLSLTAAPSVALRLEGDLPTWTGIHYVTVSITSAQRVVQVIYTVDGSTQAVTSSSGTFAFGLDSDTFADGYHTLQVTALDVNLARGNDARGVFFSNPGVHAVYSHELQVPACLTPFASCSTGPLEMGRGVGDYEFEPNAPNTLHGSCADGTFGSLHYNESLDKLKISSLDGNPVTAGKPVEIDATVWVLVPNLDFLDLYYTTNVDSPQWQYLTTLPTQSVGLALLSTVFTPTASSTIQAIRGNFRRDGSPAPCTTGYADDHDDLAFVLADTSDQIPVSVRAFGTSDQGFPDMTLQAGGQILGSWTVNDTVTDYPVNVPRSLGKNLEVHYDNDLYEPPADRNLLVLGLVYNGLFMPTASTDVYKVGAWNYDDGSCETGFIRTPALYCNGYLEFPTAGLAGPQTNATPATTVAASVAIDDLSGVQIYPNPWRADHPTGWGIVFNNLPAGAEVKLFTISGQWIRTLSSSTNSLTWDLKNSSGDPVASGIYLYLIKDTHDHKRRGKLAVIR